MNTFNVKKVAEKSLQLLAESGVSGKTLKGYRSTGFGAIIRHFMKQDIFDVTSEMIDAFISEQRKGFEQGECSEWKWCLVRRGGEILKHYALTGAVEIAALRPWEPVLRKPRQSVELDSPTPEQLVDSDNIFALVWRVKQELHKKGLTKSAVRHYTSEGLSVILRKHTANSLEQYSQSLVSEMVLEKRSQYEKGQTSRVSYQNLRKASFLLFEMHSTGVISSTKLPDWGEAQREPSLEFANLLQHFCENIQKTSSIAYSTVKASRSSIRALFFELEAHGRESFDGVTLSEISAVITNMAKRYTGGLHSAIYSVRIFLRYLYENNFTAENLSIAIPEMVACRTVFREGFTESETERLLEEANRETAIGKRDYAIMLLATQTGLRACDVVNLKREDIDWRKQEIRIGQKKTFKPLALPLEPESGNAIADYLLHARPKSDLSYIFLCHTGVLRPIKNNSTGDIVKRHMKRAGIVSDIPRRGFHSFRRSLGTRLLQSETPIELLRQLLGHSQIDSAKPYLSVDEQGLKNCALGLVDDGKSGELA